MQASKYIKAQIFAHRKNKTQSHVNGYIYGKKVLDAIVPTAEVEGCDMWTTKDIINYINKNSL